MNISKNKFILAAAFALAAHSGANQLTDNELVPEFGASINATKNIYKNLKESPYKTLYEKELLSIGVRIFSYAPSDDCSVGFYFYQNKLYKICNSQCAEFEKAQTALDIEEHIHSQWGKKYMPASPKRTAGVGKNKQGYADNMEWVTYAKKGVIVNHASSADDNILQSLAQLESMENWHAIQSMYDRRKRIWKTEGKNIEELIKMINTLSDIKDRTKNPNDGVEWKGKDTVAINGAIYTRKQLGPYRAAGMYQFMPETAIKYGLEIDHTKGIDERFDEEKAKEASRRYMNELLEMYGGNLDLALAAYNTGEKNVGAFLEGNKKLAKKTIGYIPIFFSRMEDHIQYRKQNEQLAGDL
jgi:hypothetical protein